MNNPAERFGKRGPGNSKGSIMGRRQALGVLDKLLAVSENKEKLRKAFQEYFDSNPLKFFREIVMPLLPKDKDFGTAQAARPTAYSTEAIIYSMDKTTCELTSGYRLRMPVVTSEGNT